MALDLATYLVFFLILALNYAVLCLGLNLQWGFTGLFNVGVAGFFAIGAYTSAILTGPPRPDAVGGFDLPVLIGWLGGMLAAGVAALGVGWATLRLRHDYLAITTFGIAVTIQLVALNEEWLTGGAFGIEAIPRPLAAWFTSPTQYNLFYLGLTLALVALVFWGLERLVRGPWGRLLRAIREDEVAAASLGKDVRTQRLIAFALGSAIMGLAGAHFATFMGFIAPESFLPVVTFQVWAMLILGGSGNNRGAVLGAILVWGLWSVAGVTVKALLPPDLQVRGAALQVVLIGVVLAGVLLVRPRGLMGEERAISPHTQATATASTAPSSTPASGGPDAR